MQPFCFGKENKEKKQHGIVGYITIWEGNSKHTWVGNSLYKMQNYLEHYKKNSGDIQNLVALLEKWHDEWLAF